MVFLFFWALWSILGAALLSKHNKAGIGCILGLILGPIGAIVAWSMRDKANSEQKIVESKTTVVELREERECPFCAERILSKATTCKHCGKDVPPPKIVFQS